MVDMTNLEDIDKPITEEELEDFEKELNAFPEPPEELQDKQYLKDKKEWKKKLTAKYVTNRINKVLKIREDYKKSQSDIEKEFIYSPGMLERMGSFFLKRTYLRIMIIMPHGVIKEFNKPIKKDFVNVLKGRYIIQLDSMVKYKGKNTLYYHYNNPFPITFDKDRFPYIVDSQSLENMFTTNIVSQVFSAGSAGKVIATTFATLGGVALIIFVIVTFLPASVKDATSGFVIGGRWLWTKMKMT